MFKLAVRNLIEKPLKLTAQVLAIAFAVAVFFVIISYKQAVYDYFYDIRTLFSGDSDILISYGAGDSRVTAAVDLGGVVDAEYVVGVLTFYGLADGEYVRVAGTGKSDFGRVRRIEYVSPFTAPVRDNDAVISESFAKARGLKTGDILTLSVMGKERVLFIGAIAADEGWFDKRGGFETVMIPDVTAAGFFSEIAAGGLYNQIYVKLKPGEDADKSVAAINASGLFKDMTAARAVNPAEVERTSGIFASPLLVVGAAAVFLVGAIIVFLFAVTFKGRSAYVSKLKTSGADNRKLFAIFFTENLMLAAAASLIGLAIANGLFQLLFRLSFDGGRVAAAAPLSYVLAFTAGTALTVAAGLFPVLRSIGKPIKESLDLSRGNAAKLNPVPFAVALLLSAAAFVTEIVSDAAKPYAGFISLVLWLITAVFAAPFLLKFLGNALARLCLREGKATRTVGKLKRRGSNISNLATRKATRTVGKLKRAEGNSRGEIGESLSYAAAVAGFTAGRSRSQHIIASLVAAGMAVSMLFITASSVTASHFGDYAEGMGNGVIIKGLRSADSGYAALLTESEDIKTAAPLFWQEGGLIGKGEGQIHILGVDGDTAEQLFDWDYVTEREVVLNALSDPDGGSVILDYSYTAAYGIKAGEFVTVSYAGKSAAFKVAGFVKSDFYVGQYVLCNSEALAGKLGTPEYDSIWITPDGDAQRLVNRLRAEYADKGWYVLTVKEIDANGNAALSQILVFVDALSVAVAAAAVLGVIMNIVLNRAESKRARSQFLSAGMSKRQLFVSELVSQILTAAAAFIAALPAAAAMMKSVSDGILAFGLYYEYEFDLAAALSVSLPVFAIMALLPLILWYPKGYAIKIADLKVL